MTPNFWGWDVVLGLSAWLGVRLGLCRGIFADFDKNESSRTL
jgi:hypothetical protein